MTVTVASVIGGDGGTAFSKFPKSVVVGGSVLTRAQSVHDESKINFGQDLTQLADAAVGADLGTLEAKSSIAYKSADDSLVMYKGAEESLKAGASVVAVKPLKTEAKVSFGTSALVGMSFETSVDGNGDFDTLEVKDTGDVLLYEVKGSQVVYDGNFVAGSSKLKEANDLYTYIDNNKTSADSAILANATAITALDTSSTAKVDAEAAARAAAITTLTATVTANKALHDSLQSDYDALTAGLDNAALDQISEVITAFQGADASLQGSLTALTTNTATDRAAIRSEFAAADATLQANIDAEAARAQAAEQVNADAIAAEATSRVAADATLTESLTNASTAFNTYVSSNDAAVESFKEDVFGVASIDDVDFASLNLTILNTGLSSTNTNLTAEIARAEAAEQVNAAAISTEQAARISADTALGVRIDDAESAHNTYVSTNDTRVAAIEAMNTTQNTSITTIDATVTANKALHDTLAGEFADLTANMNNDALDTIREIADKFGDMTASETVSALFTAAQTDRTAIRQEFADADTAAATTNSTARDAIIADLAAEVTRATDAEAAITAASTVALNEAVATRTAVTDGHNTRITSLESSRTLRESHFKIDEASAEAVMTYNASELHAIKADASKVALHGKFMMVGTSSYDPFTADPNTLATGELYIDANGFVKAKLA
eukprot:jgi/Bigna1/129880/aug1.10_g4588